MSGDFIASYDLLLLRASLKCECAHLKGDKKASTRIRKIFGLRAPTLSGLLMEFEQILRARGVKW